MATRRYGFTPTHPEEVLKDAIEVRNTATTMLIEEALDVPAESLMKLQLKYNMFQVQNDRFLMDCLRQVRRYVAML